MARDAGFKYEKRYEGELDDLVGVPDRVPRPDQNPEEDRKRRIADENPPCEVPVVRDHWYRQDQRRQKSQVTQPVEDEEWEALEAEVEVDQRRPDGQDDHTDPEWVIRGDARRGDRK